MVFFRLIIFMVDAHDYGDVFILCRGADDNLLGSGFHMG